MTLFIKTTGIRVPVGTELDDTVFFRAAGSAAGPESRGNLESDACNCSIAALRSTSSSFICSA